jgi:hypothetical protein
MNLQMKEAANLGGGGSLGLLTMQRHFIPNHGDYKSGARPEIVEHFWPARGETCTGVRAAIGRGLWRLGYSIEEARQRFTPQQTEGEV